MTAATVTLRRSRPRRLGLRLNAKIAAGIVILVVFAVLAISHPILRNTIWSGSGRSIYDPFIGYDTQVVHPSAPSATHWLGTDSLGRDVASLFTYSARFSVAVAFTAGIAIGVVSMVLGGLAAYSRGWLDSVITHLSDAMVLLPALLAVYIIGVGQDSADFGAAEMGLTFGVLYGLGPATATVRAAALGVMAKPFVDASRLAGAGMVRIVTRHVMPHLVPHAAVQAMIGVAGAVIAEAFLAFRSGVGSEIGFGYLVLEGLTWGELFAGVLETPWSVMIAGAAGITLLASGFYLFGVGLRELFDPHEVAR